jgi:phosphoribosylamine--glycine ligase
VGLALRLQEEGHEVCIWIRDSEAASNCKGLLEEVEDFTVDHDTLVVADCTGSGVHCDTYRAAGCAVLGGSAIADKLETDRAYATEIFESCGIETPKAESFTDWEQAREYVETLEERLVFKPEGDLSGVVPSYVSTGVEDMLAMLEFYKAQQPATVPAFALQEFIEGTCVSTEAWFSIDHFVRPFNHTIERKQLMNDDLGPSGGCTGNVVWGCFDTECPICEETVVRLEGFLRSVSYAGPIDVNVVVSDDGIYALEFTPRFGYDATPTLLCSLLSSPIGIFLDSVAIGNCEEMPLFPGFSAGVRLTVPPWPSEKFHAGEGIPLRGLKSFDRFYPYNVMKGEETDFVTSGAYGIVGIALGSGASIDEAFADAYKLAKKIKLPDKQYRTDLAEVCSKDYRKLVAYVKENA